MSSLERMRAALRIMRTILGAPDYQRYCEHMRRHHPEAGVVTEREFVDQRLAARYERHGSRCC